MDWAAGLDVRVLAPGDPAPEVLFWVGCAGAFDERAREATRSTVRLLQAAGIDVAVLGQRESCTGDPARRMGHEFLFQTLAERNVSTLNEAGVTTIVASCAHCFNTLANEYPDYGGTYEVVHHSELLSRLVGEGRLHPVTRVGRGDLPRRVLPRPSQRQVRRAPRRARRRHGLDRRDAAQPRALVLLRCRRREVLDGGRRRRPHQRHALRGSRRHRRRRRRDRLPVLPRDARRRLERVGRRRARGRRRRDPARPLERSASDSKSLVSNPNETTSPRGRRSGAGGIEEAFQPNVRDPDIR